MYRIVMLAVAALAVLGCGKDDGKDARRGGRNVEAAYRLADGASHRYQVIFSQSVDMDIGGQPVNAERSYKTVFTLAPRGNESNPIGATIGIESLDAELTTSDGRQVFDTSHIVGSAFDITLDAKGGPPSYATNPPSIDTGAIAGKNVNLAFLFDYAFPRLPDGPVEVGSTWRTTPQRTQVEGSIPVTSEVSTSHQLAGFEALGGVDCMKISTQSESVLEGAIADMSPPWRYRGRLRASGIWHFDPDDGSLVLLKLEEVTQGNSTMDSVSAIVQQRTNIQVKRLGP